MESIVQIPGQKGASGPRAQSIRDEVRHLWGRLQLQLPPFRDDHLNLAFCSTHPSEGTTTVAANFSIFLGQQGIRNTLVECNLRNPSLADHFGVPRSPGVCEFLDETARLEEALRSEVSPGVDMIPAGAPPADVYTRLSERDEVKRLFSALKTGNELFVIDVPPLAVSPEAASILHVVNAAVLVVQSDRTRRKSVEKSVQTLDELGVPCCGIVLNRLQYDIPPFIEQVL